jgi:glycine/D-amino acid oxidase-like deaminating enzyme
VTSPATSRAISPAAVSRALADAAPAVFWLDDPAAPGPAPRLGGRVSCDLAVVGGGYLGLWTALLAKQRQPDLDVAVLEADRCGHAASGRNGGFCSATLTHGYPNGQARWPQEMATLERLGRDNLDGIERTVRRFGIDCGFERTGELSVATRPHEADELAELAPALIAAGHDIALLDREGVRAEVRSPTYLAGLWDRSGTAMVEPARLAWGLRAAAESLGVRVYERSPVSAVTEAAEDRLALTCAGDTRRPDPTAGTVLARQVVLATNAARPLLRRLRLFTVPVYDYVLVTEPLDAGQRESVGWRHRQGIGDAGNQFHYYRLTRDQRILWGGYDAVYHYASTVGPRHEHREPTYAMLAEHFFTTFPQLEGIRFTHKWGGVIDTCTRFSAFYGTAHRGRLAYALGFTGLGVGATRFAGQVLLDLLAGERTERTALAMVRHKPVPFPPEPLRYLGVQATRWSLARADASAGRRNLWLRTLDRLGLGFDS